MLNSADSPSEEIGLRNLAPQPCSLAIAAKNSVRAFEIISFVHVDACTSVYSLP